MQNAEPKTIIDFHGPCEVITSKYVESGRLAIMLEDAATGEPVAIATINMPEIPLSDDEVVIKDYAENEGLLEVLQAAGIVREVVRYVQAGWVEVPVVKVDLEKIGTCRHLV